MGSQTLDFFLQQDPSEEVAGLVRSKKKGAELKEKGIETRIGDYDDYESLLEAMKGINTLLLISSSSLEGRVQQHQNVIGAAEETGINHIFYTSILQADKQLSPLAPDHHETEKNITGSGINYTIYRNTFYGEFLPMYLEDALQTGDWYFPSGGQEINLALRSEMAEGLAKGLTDVSQHRNEVYEITSGKTYNLDEAGLPVEAIMMSSAVATTFVNGGINYTDNALTMLLGREPAAVEDFLSNMI